MATSTHEIEINLSIADTIWLATALLHRENPQASGFDHSAILRKAMELNPSLNSRSVSTHLSSHCIAGKPANPATLRILTENPDGSLRLYREGDPYHPTRRGGRTSPKPHALPDHYRDLLKSYGQTSPAQDAVPPEEDPILAISGVGREMWSRFGGGTDFIKKLREEIFPANASSSEFEEVWERIRAHGGQEFRTVRDLAFSYTVGNNWIIPRPGKGEETNQVVSMGEFEKAWNRRPLSGPSQLRDLRGSSYVYAILTDPRICKA